MVDQVVEFKKIKEHHEENTLRKDKLDMIKAKEE